LQSANINSARFGLSGTDIGRIPSRDKSWLALKRPDHFSQHPCRSRKQYKSEEDTGWVLPLRDIFQHINLPRSRKLICLTAFFSLSLINHLILLNPYPLPPNKQQSNNITLNNRACFFLLLNFRFG